MANAHKMPGIIYGMFLVKSVPVGSLDFMHITQIQICGRGNRYNVLRFKHILDVDEATPDYEIIARGQDIKSAIANAITAENEQLANKWLIYDRWPVRAEDGLDTIAHQIGIERLLVGMDMPRHTWVYAPPTFPDWQWRAAEQGLRVVRPEP